jgi:sporulation-control protein
MAFKSFMRAFGVGGPTVDAVLDTDRVEAGGLVTGTLHIRGGDASKHADRAKLQLVARIEKKMGDDEYQADEIIAQTVIPGPIPLGRDHAFRFGLDLPPYTPVTSLGGHNHVWVGTDLDVPWAVDPADRDPLVVYPTQLQSNVLQAMEQLGFRLAKVDIEARSSWMGRKWAQEFEFRPARHGSRFDEVEVVFEGQRGNKLELMLQLDRSARGFGGFLMEMSGTDESWKRITVDASSPQAAAADLSRVVG